MPVMYKKHLDPIINTYPIAYIDIMHAQEIPQKSLKCHMLRQSGTYISGSHQHIKLQY